MDQQELNTGSLWNRKKERFLLPPKIDGDNVLTRVVLPVSLLAE